MSRGTVSGLKTDVHAHFVSPALVPEALAHPDRYGITLEGERLALSEHERAARPQPFLLDLERHRAFLAAEGIDRMALSLWIDIQGYGLTPSQGAAWCRLINRTLSEAVRGDARFAVFGAVPLQDPGLAAEVLAEGVGDLGLRGAQIATHILDRGLDGPELDPFWRQAEALRVPILIHPYDIDPPARVRRYARQFLVANPFDTVLAASDLMFGGVADRFPDLRVVLCHGGGFLPYQAGRLQKGYATRADIRNGMRQAPRDYLSWFHYDTVLSRPESLRFLAETVGVGRVVLGSDYPYGFGDLTPLASLAEAGFSEAEQRAIAVDNPARLLGEGPR